MNQETDCVMLGWAREHSTEKIMVATVKPDLEELMQIYGVPSSGKSLSGHFDVLETLELTETAHSRGRSVSEIIVAATKLTMDQLSQSKIAKAIMAHRATEKPLINPAIQRRIDEGEIPVKGKTLTGHFSPRDAVDLLQVLERLRKDHPKEEFSISEFLVTMTLAGLPAAKKFYPAIQEQ